LSEAEEEGLGSPHVQGLAMQSAIVRLLSNLVMVSRLQEESFGLWEASLDLMCVKIAAETG
jgi:hypothetical protein